MGTILLGGKTLDVVRPTLGFKKHKLIPWRDQLQAAGNDEAKVIDAVVDGLLLYLGHNEGVTREWIEQFADDDTLTEVARAAGQKPAAPGEGSRP